MLLTCTHIYIAIYIYKYIHISRLQTMIFTCATLKGIAWPFSKRTAPSFIALAMRRSPAFPTALTYPTLATYSSVIHTEIASMWPVTHGKAYCNPNSSAHMSRFAYEARFQRTCIRFLNKNCLCIYSNIAIAPIYIYIYIYL